MSWDLLTTKMLDYIVHFVVGEEFGEGKNFPVQSRRIGDDPGDIFTNISAISQPKGNVAVSGDICAIKQQVPVKAAGG